MTQVDQMAGHVIRRLHQLSTHVFAQQMKALGLDLTPVQFAAMDAIAACPRIDQAGIAAHIAYDRATIGGVIDRLEAKGYVAREVSKRDRRAREVLLTSKGSELLDRVVPTITAFQSDILPGLTAAEREQLLALMQKSLGSSEKR